MNVAFLERVGMTRQELIDRPIADVVGPATNELIRAAMESDSASIGADPKFASAEVEDPKLRGTFAVTLTPLVGEERESIGIVLVARDVTPQAELEAERADLRNRLIQSEKLAALGQFVAGIAHELNNPLQGVLGHLELLRATGAFPKALRRDIQRIYREADRAAKIVRNLLVFAGSRRLVRRRTSVNAALSRVLLLRAEACRAANIEVVRRHADGLPRVKGDPLLIQQALLNIVLNAEQAIGANGGRIETTTSLRERRRRRADRRPDPRHRPRHCGGGDTARVRTLLHDERSRKGHRPRARDYLWHHSRARRADRGIEPSRGRRVVHGADTG